MSKRILNHQAHVAIIAERKINLGTPVKPVWEAEHSVCVRLAAKYCCGKGRVYELRHGIHTPQCCSMSGPALVMGQPKVGWARKTVAKIVGDGQPIIGFRMWNWTKSDEGKAKLESYNGGNGKWVPGQTFVATCAAGGKHEIPAPIDCCGVHSYKKKTAADLLVRSAEGILGAVVNTGKVREHSEGYRSQFAKILCFSVKPAEDKHDVMLQAKEDTRYNLRVKRTEALAIEYGVPIISYEHIELYVSEFGQTL